MSGEDWRLASPSVLLSCRLVSPGAFLATVAPWVIGDLRKERVWRCRRMSCRVAWCRLSCFWRQWRDGRVIGDLGAAFGVVASAVVASPGVASSVFGDSWVAATADVVFRIMGFFQFRCGSRKISRRGAEAQRIAKNAKAAFSSSMRSSAPPRLCERDQGAPATCGRTFTLADRVAHFQLGSSRDYFFDNLARISCGAAVFFFAGAASLVGRSGGSLARGCWATGL